jgi:predicted transcriptional regulator
MLPTSFYRTFYETSVTLSSRVSKDTHVKHRERQDLKITKGNAFQAVGRVVLERDLTKQRIERHLVWNKKRGPSTWISVFNALRKLPLISTMK